MNRFYEIIYADPPWRYEHAISDSRRIENQYPTMDLEEIKRIEVPSADDCVLFLWATAPKLEESLEVLNAWGFRYRTHLIWDKKVIGMGYWFRSQHEILLVGTKGNISPPIATMRISSIFVEKRREHSQKPDSIRKLIEKWYPEKAKLEMFCRQRHNGWNTQGNQLSKDVQYDLQSIIKEGRG
jgi:N6-adenosine-specific RNA methylase IME4